MLNITHYQRNANQNHSGVPLHASQDGCYPKVYKQSMLERVWRKGNPLTLLVGMQTSTATMENSMEISLKTGTRTPTPVFLPGESHGQKSLVGCSPWGRKMVKPD